jgi:hypothetical protein
VPELELEDDPGDVVDPTVLSVFPDGPVALVPLLSRTRLLPTSQHWLVEAPLEPPVPVPCAFAKLATASSAAPEATAKMTFFMDVPSFVWPARMPARVNALAQTRVPLGLLHNI